MENGATALEADEGLKDAGLGPSKAVMPIGFQAPPRTSAEFFWATTKEFGGFRGLSGNKRRFCFQSLRLGGQGI